MSNDCAMRACDDVQHPLLHRDVVGEHTDKPEHREDERMARVVEGVEAVLSDLANNE
jgi:hypothetical protein